MAAPVSGRCAFFVDRKKRFCKMIVGKGKRFCGEHAAMEEGAGSRRIVCPLDPKHTVSEDKLEKHLKKCNSREKPKPVYFVQDRNAGSEDESEMAEVSLSQRSQMELTSLLDKLKSAVKGLQCDLEEQVLSHEALQEELDNLKNGESAQKHLRQQASLLAHMDGLGLLAGGRCFVEFGAGRGKLSHWIHQALRHESELQLLLVERSSMRFKVDGKHVDSGAEFERLQVDIQHLDLSGVPLLRDKRLPVVGVGKHLCGAATDLTLRCLLENPRCSVASEPLPKRLRPSHPSSDLARPGSPAEPWGPAVMGLTVALCCHHRCQWRHYVGKDFFRRRGLGADDFSAFCRMSSWATCGLRPTNHRALPQNQINQDHATHSPANQRGEEEREEHEPAEEMDNAAGFLSPSERERVGCLCKLLIDRGRVDYLQSRGFIGRLIRYVSSEVTLENVLLTAVPTSSAGATATCASAT